MAVSRTSYPRRRGLGVIAFALGLAASLLPVGPASAAASGDDVVANMIATYRQRIPELMAEQDVPVWKKRVRPVLTVRCLGNKTEVFVMTFSPASIEQNGSMHTVSVGFDGGPEVTQEWEHADDHSALFAEDGRAVARRIAAASTMTFEFTPFNAQPVTAEFDVSGFQTHLKSVARTCSWK